MSKSDYAAAIKNIFDKASAAANTPQRQQIEQIVEAAQKHGESLKTAAEIYTSIGEVFKQAGQSVLDTEAAMRKDANPNTAKRLTSALKIANDMVVDIPIETIIAGLGMIGYDMDKFVKTATELQRQASQFTSDECDCPKCAATRGEEISTPEASEGVAVTSDDDLDSKLAHIPEEIRGVVKSLLGNGSIERIEVIKLDNSDEKGSSTVH